ncbi:hypothetical protein AMAG_19028 [Allomyces macrogynus ATCC 38327]|uniref:Uncharacterized protein n=1 Tax=Allomyces macrogynus (strain ATCC 38327) TaxID=578462 RepID=A0A0L0SMP7_ALLM3|nr:hypothetical protein AMAG_19028 [Allomyces macrogynus ATCC 38327]|eukprot:KNE63649.1 hypothetical protein AMAG_19028 [Allomyces macrogynus ATCC 38327]
MHVRWQGPRDLVGNGLGERLLRGRVGEHRLGPRRDQRARSLVIVVAVTRNSGDGHNNHVEHVMPLEKIGLAHDDQVAHAVKRLAAKCDKDGLGYFRGGQSSPSYRT